MNQPRNTGNCCLAYRIIQGDKYNCTEDMQRQSVCRGRSPFRGEDVKPCRKCWGLVVNMKNDHFSASLWGHCRLESQLTANLNRSIDNERDLILSFFIWRQEAPKNLHRANPRVRGQKITEVGGRRMREGRERERTFFFLNCRYVHILGTKQKKDKISK